MRTDAVTDIFTLGPTGTNCERAAEEWFRRSGVSTGTVHLHATLEDALEAMPMDGHAALLGCVVYPDLHNLVFENLHRITLADQFLMPTFNMVLASRDGSRPGTVATHPAPQSLVPSGMTKKLTTSNSQAARECAAGLTDGCISTLPAVKAHGLTLVEDFGPVQMGFTLHVPVRAAVATAA
ncbi:type 2 periplasmic-binding domain-containing protein [Catenuloplanes japonicus]|uniref:hypothetical protein n=1 Tax=Catenuloplanes japonicus TaxID=33876 RepID=UPI0005279FA2|nr:hypothetical protein [Catenuloplanes japonicus]